MSDIDAMIEEYRKEIAADPTNVRAHCNLGAVLNQAGQQEAAITEFREALKLNPMDHSAHYNLGNVLVHTGREDEGMAEYQNALDFDSDGEHATAAHVGLGAVHFRNGKLDEAIAAFRGARDSLTTFKAVADVKQEASAMVHYNLGQALLGLSQSGRGDVHKNLQEAIQCFQQTLSAKPAFPNASKNLETTRTMLEEGFMITDPETGEIKQFFSGTLSGER